MLWMIWKIAGEETKMQSCRETTAMAFEAENLKRTTRNEESKLIADA